MAGSKRFFFEKNNQNTFAELDRDFGTPEAQINKVFCFFLFTKRRRLLAALRGSREA
jgi:hypothetical protein